MQHEQATGQEQTRAAATRARQHQQATSVALQVRPPVPTSTSMPVNADADIIADVEDEAIENALTNRMKAARFLNKT